MTDHRTHVVVLGGGYAGTLAANHLRMRDDVDVTLVNPRPQFVERIRLHQLIAGTHGATADYDALLGDHVTLVVDHATRIDACNRTVELETRDPLKYDYLIYAVGSSGSVPSSVPGVAEFAFSVADLESAHRLKAHLETVDESAPVVVVGGGLTGIETATELAERGRNVALVCGGELGPSLAGPTRRSIRRWLRRHDVDVHTASVVEVSPTGLMLDNGTEVPSVATIWAAGFGVPQLAEHSGLRTDHLGRLITDETLTTLDDEHIVAAGDAAAPSGHPLRMSCQAAGPLGLQAANTVMSRISGTAPAPIDQRFVGSCISLGRRAGVFQIARKDDSPVNAYLGGRPAASLKEFICKSTVTTLEREARKPGSAIWLKGGERPASDAAVTLT